jgi:hypothetical protein
MAFIDKADACGALVTVLLLAGAAHALSPADKCEASKLKTAGKYDFCRLLAEAKAAKRGGTPDFSTCDAAYSAKWSAAETKAGGMCPSNGDEKTVQSFIIEHSDAVAALAAGTLPEGVVSCSALLVGDVDTENQFGDHHHAVTVAIAGACFGVRFISANRATRMADAGAHKAALVEVGAESVIPCTNCGAGRGASRWRARCRTQRHRLRRPAVVLQSRGVELRVRVAQGTVRCAEPAARAVVEVVAAVVQGRRGAAGRDGDQRPEESRIRRRSAVV